MLVSMSSHCSTYTWLVGMQRGSATFKNSLTASYKVKRTQPSNPTCRHLPKRNENICLLKEWFWQLYL